MRLSTTLVLLVAIVTGTFHTVMVSALPYGSEGSGHPPITNNPNKLSTGQHPVLQRSVPTTPLQLGSDNLPLDSQSDSKLNKQELNPQKASVHNSATFLQSRAYVKNEAVMSQLVQRMNSGEITHWREDGWPTKYIGGVLPPPRSSNSAKKEPGEAATSSQQPSGQHAPAQSTSNAPRSDS
ncbi:hypothetical protein BC835DRAFT_1354136 [Cytidiella melzeri]|nr:hypothetical protein BC835DRAFT_1354136 [Cytidiella melzeri]